MIFLDSKWADLNWTPFVKFDAEIKEFRQHSTSPGVYRVRVSGRNELAYIGQTGRDLRARLQALKSNTFAREMPFNDPHTAACRLWSFRDADGCEFECSSAAIELPKAKRLALECFLLWQYRLQQGESTLCNFGRLHPEYQSSANRSTGKRGFRLPSGTINTNVGKSIEPLRYQGCPNDSDWMGLNWSCLRPLVISETASLPQGTGVYKLIGDENEVLYIGESSNLRSRLRTHCDNPDHRDAVFAYCALDHAALGCQRLEVENDLIAAYFSETKQPPRLQFGSTAAVSRH